MHNHSHHTHGMDSNPELMRRATYASVLVASILVIIKLAAWFLTGSVSLLSSLIDSALDLMASVLNMLAVRHALTPADEIHRFGHGKIEPLAGLGQAAFITGSSVFLSVEAIHRLINPQIIDFEIKAVDALKIMKNNKISQLIVTKENKYYGVLHIQNIIKEGIS